MSHRLFRQLLTEMRELDKLKKEKEAAHREELAPIKSAFSQKWNAMREIFAPFARASLMAYNSHVRQQRLAPEWFWVSVNEESGKLCVLFNRSVGTPFMDAEEEKRVARFLLTDLSRRLKDAGFEIEIEKIAHDNDGM